MTIHILPCSVFQSKRESVLEIYLLTLILVPGIMENYVSEFSSACPEVMIKHLVETTNYFGSVRASSSGVHYYGPSTSETEGGPEV